MIYPRNEIWIRKVYKSLVRDKALTTIFRPGERICNGQNNKYFDEGEELKVRVLEKQGNEQEGIEPVFSNLEKRVKIIKMNIINIDDLKGEDFEGSSPDVQSQEQLRYNLGLIYNQEPKFFNLITKIQLEYLN